MPARLPGGSTTSLTAPAPGPSCENCGTPLRGDYCHACGQQVLLGGELTVRHAFRTVADDVLHLESKTLRSLGLLFVPGLLTSRYLSGHRAPYTAPLKLYFAAAAIFFLCAPFAGFTLADLTAADRTGAFEKLIAGAMATRDMSREVFVERFDVRFQSVYTAGLFASVFAGAFVLALLYRGQRRPFGAHVVFELHYVALLYLFTIAFGIVAGWFGIVGTLTALGASLVYIVPYLFLALRRVYGESNGRTAWKFAVLFLFALVFDNLVNFLAVIVTLRLV